MKEFKYSINFPDYGMHGPLRGTGTTVTFKILAPDLESAQHRIAEAFRSLPNYVDSARERVKEKGKR